MSVYGGGGYGGPGGGAPKVRFDAIGEAWKLAQAKFGVWVPTVLIYVVVIYACAFGTSFVAAMMNGGSQEPSALFYIVSLLGQIVTTAATSLMLGGMSRMAIRQTRGEEIGVGDLFSATDVLVNIIIAGVLVYLGTVLGTLACVVPGLLVASLWMLTVPLIVDQRLSAIDAMTRSWEALKPDMWTALGVYFVAAILASLGGLACGIGILFTFPLLPLTQAIIYRDFFGGGGYANAPESFPQYPPQGPQPPPYQQGGYPPQQR